MLFFDRQAAKPGFFPIKTERNPANQLYKVFLVHYSISPNLAASPQKKKCSKKLEISRFHHQVREAIKRNGGWTDPVPRWEFHPAVAC